MLTMPNGKPVAPTAVSSPTTAQPQPTAVSNGYSSTPTGTTQGDGDAVARPAAPTPQQPAPAPAPSPTQPSGTTTQDGDASAKPFNPWGAVDPNSSYSPEDAVKQIETRIRRPLTPEEKAQAAKLIGWDGKSPLTGTQLNQIIQEAARLSGGSFTPFSPTGNPTPAPPGGGGGGTPGAPGGNAALPPQVPYGGVGQIAPAPALQDPGRFSHTNPFGQDVNALVQQLLQSPGTMGPQFQDQLFESLKEQGTSMRDQLAGQATQNSVAMGRSGGSPATQAILSGLDNNLMQGLLAGRRDISTQAAIQNRQDQLQALGVAQGVDAQNFGQSFAGFGANSGLTMDMNRLRQGQWAAEQGFGFQQADQEFRRDAATNSDNLQRWGMTEGSRQFDTTQALQRLLADRGFDLENRQFSEGQRQFDKGMGLDFLRFLEGRRQFDTGLGEDRRQFDVGLGENSRQFNNRSAYDWWNGQQNQNNNFLDFLLRSGVL